MKQLTLISCLGLFSLTACVGNSKVNSNKPNDSITDTKIKYLTADGLDGLSKYCYTHDNYYDPADKVHVFINNDGVIGGDIMSQDTPDSKDCTFHPYIWDNKEFKVFSFVGSELSRCADLAKCSVRVHGIGDQNNIIGTVYTYGMEDISGYGIFYHENQNYHAYGRGKYGITSGTEPNLIFSQNLQNILSLKVIDHNDSHSSTEDLRLLNYNITTNLFSNAISNYDDDRFYNMLIQAINNNGIFLYNKRKTRSSADYFNTVVGDVNTKQIQILSKDNISLEINTLSNNSQYAYGLALHYTEPHTPTTIVRLEPLNDNRLTEITDLPFTTDNSDIATIQALDDGVLLLSVSHYQENQLSSKLATTIESKIFYLYSSESAKFYKFDDVLTALELSKYIGKYNMTTNPVKFSPNGHYMVLDIHNITPAEIAVKVNFAEGLDKFLQANVKPISKE